jgi:hypothetical protein
MDRGLIILMSFAVVLTISVILEAMEVLSAVHVQAVIMLCLIYHTCYTIFAITEWNGRYRIRNVKRSNLRPPRGGAL